MDGLAVPGNNDKGRDRRLSSNLDSLLNPNNPFTYKDRVDSFMAEQFEGEEPCISEKPQIKPKQTQQINTKTQ